MKQDIVKNSSFVRNVTVMVQIRFHASFHMPKMSSDTKFTQLWQLWQEKMQDRGKLQEQSYQLHTHTSIPMSRSGQGGKHIEMFIRKSKETVMNRRLGKEKRPSQHHLSKYKYPESSPSSIITYLCWLNWYFPAFHKQEKFLGKSELTSQ